MGQLFTKNWSSTDEFPKKRWQGSNSATRLYFTPSFFKACMPIPCGSIASPLKKRAACVPRFNFWKGAHVLTLCNDQFRCYTVQRSLARILLDKKSVEKTTSSYDFAFRKLPLTVSNSSSRLFLNMSSSEQVYQDCPLIRSFNSTDLQLRCWTKLAGLLKRIQSSKQNRTFERSMKCD